MRDLIINNFIRKHLPPVSDYNDRQAIEKQVRLTGVIQDHVDKYLSANVGEDTVKSVRLLEEQLLQLLSRHTNYSTA